MLINVLGRKPMPRFRNLVPSRISFSNLSSITGKQLSQSHLPSLKMESNFIRSSSSLANKQNKGNTNVSPIVSADKKKAQHHNIAKQLVTDWTKQSQIKGSAGRLFYLNSKKNQQMEIPHMTDRSKPSSMALGLATRRAKRDSLAQGGTPSAITYRHGSITNLTDAPQPGSMLTLNSETSPHLRDAMTLSKASGGTPTFSIMSPVAPLNYGSEGQPGNIHEAPSKVQAALMQRLAEERIKAHHVGFSYGGTTTTETLSKASPEVQQSSTLHLPGTGSWNQSEFRKNLDSVTSNTELYKGSLDPITRLGGAYKLFSGKPATDRPNVNVNEVSGAHNMGGTYAEAVGARIKELIEANKSKIDDVD